MSAIISPCGTYRYMLKRPPLQANPMGSSVPFVMLNPSTADAELDDPTIRRLRGFSRDWDCNGIVVMNVYALRSTDPSALRSHADPRGPDNDYWLRQLGIQHETIVVAWGAHAKPDDVANAVKHLRCAGAELKCLGRNKDGSPKHPLYLAAKTQLQPWSP